jgi:hypothetical protein
LTDLRLNKKDMPRWAKHPDATDELVNLGWWEDRGNHYMIIHHGAYQRTREAVVRQQEANRRNGRKNGKKAGPPREQAADLKPRKSDSSSDSLSERDGSGLAGIRGEGTEATVPPDGWPEWKGSGPDPFMEYV